MDFVEVSNVRVVRLFGVAKGPRSRADQDSIPKFHGLHVRIEVSLRTFGVGVLLD